MAMFNEKITSQFRDILAGMSRGVAIAYFTQEVECHACLQTRIFLEELTSLSDRLSCEVYDFIKDRQWAERYGVDKIPGIVLLDENGTDSNMKYYGIPIGYEINSFLGSILELSGNKEALPADVAARVAAIDRDVHVQVFVTLSCPYCPEAVAAAHRLALENKKIRSDMIDTGLFPHLAVKYQVSGVPKIVINEVQELVGTQTITQLLDSIETLPAPDQA